MSIIKNTEIEGDSEERALDAGAWEGIGLDSFGENMSGVRVTATKALTLPVVYGIASSIANTVASMGIETMLDDGHQKIKAKDHPAYRLVKKFPNDMMTAATFWQTLIACRFIYGNGYALINRDENFNPIELLPLSSEKTAPKMIDGELWYFTQVGSETIAIRPYDIIHLKSLSFSGLEGYGIFKILSQSIGMGLAADQFSAKFFQSGAAIRGVIEHAGSPTEKAVAAIRNSWEKMYSGVKNAHKTVLLREGMTFKPISVNPRDAMLLEMRRYQVADIARAANYPISMLNESAGGLTYSTPYANDGHLLKHTIGSPYLIPTEQELNMKLLREDEQDTYYFKFNTSTMLKADTKTRYHAYKIGIDGGWLTPDDVRELEDLPPLPLPKEDDEQEVEETATSIDAKSRSSLEGRYTGLLSEAAQRLTLTDTKALLRMASKYDEDAEGLAKAIKRWASKAEPIAAQAFGSIVRSLADASYDAASREVGDLQASSARYDEFAGAYIEKIAYRFVAEISKALLAIAKDGQKNKADRIRAYLETLEDRSGFAEYEARRARNAFSRQAWESMGVYGFEWRTVCECQQCLELDGKRVGAKDAFITGGSGSGAIFHAPLRRDCRCEITPIIKGNK